MTSIKVDFLKTLSLLGIFLAPQAAAMAAIFVLVLADLVTGVLVSRKKGIPVQSYGVRRTVVKLVAYEFGVLIMWLSERFLLSIPVTHAMCALIGLTELSSILKNISDLTGIDLQNVISKFAGPKP